MLEVNKNKDNSEKRGIEFRQSPSSLFLWFSGTSGRGREGEDGVVCQLTRVDKKKIKYNHGFESEHIQKPQSDSLLRLESGSVI